MLFNGRMTDDLFQSHANITEAPEPEAVPQPSFDGDGWNVNVQGPASTKVLAPLLAQLLITGKHSTAEARVAEVEREYDRTSNKAFHHSLIHACAKIGCPAAGLWLVLRMTRRGFQVNVVTFNALLDACGKAGDIAIAAEVWDLMTQVGLQPNGITYNTLAQACAQAADAEGAGRWMDTLCVEGVVPGRVAFSTVVAAFARAGKLEKAEEWIARAQDAGVRADRLMFEAMIIGNAKSGDPLKAEPWLAQMRGSGIAPSRKTYSALIHAFARYGATGRAGQWLRLMIREGLSADKWDYGVLVRAHARGGDMAEARRWRGEAERSGLELPRAVFLEVFAQAHHQSPETPPVGVADATVAAQPARGSSRDSHSPSTQPMSTRSVLAAAGNRPSAPPALPGGLASLARCASLVRPQLATRGCSQTPPSLAQSWLPHRASLATWAQCSPNTPPAPASSSSSPMAKTCTASSPQPAASSRLGIPPRAGLQAEVPWPSEYQSGQYWFKNERRP